MRRRMSLAGQLLALQLVIISVVLIGVAAVSVAQSITRFQETEGRRALVVAETVAGTASVRGPLEDLDISSIAKSSDGTSTAGLGAVRTVAETNRTVSTSTYVIVADENGVIVASPEPAQIGTKLHIGPSSVLQGRAWVGADESGGRTAVAHAPVLSAQPGEVGRLIGLVAVGRRYPTVLENLSAAAPELLTYLGIASALGVLGSLLLARRVKRQTLGLEPREIAGLFEHRDAMLYGIKEGVIALDTHNRVTMVNDEAAKLLQLPANAVGQTLDALNLDQRLKDVLAGRALGADRVVPLDGRVLILNRMPIASRGRSIGSVTTLRDRTELVTLQRELDVTKHVTDTLRAQAHEFSNTMHTISGLVELGEYAEVARYVHRVAADHTALTETITSRIEDPAVAALLVAQGSRAAEQGIEFRISPQTRLGALDENVSTDVVTIVGNLVDNALDAIAATPQGWVEVEIRDDDGGLLVRVRDSGPGVAAEIADEVFRQGYTTKHGGPGGQRGIGLALIRLICQRHGGDVTVHNEGGAVFTARLPAVSKVAS
jgi:two-component system, CitB family, sensor kinase